MEMCYDGALVMPSSYVAMDEEEMTYVEGGGTFRIKMNKAAVKYLASISGTAIINIVNVAMGATGIGAIVSGFIGSLVYNILLDCICDLKAINASWTAWYLPNYTFEWNR